MKKVLSLLFIVLFVASCSKYSTVFDNACYKSIVSPNDNEILMLSTNYLKSKAIINKYDNSVRYEYNNVSIGSALTLRNEINKKTESIPTKQDDIDKFILKNSTMWGNDKFNVEYESPFFKIDIEITHAEKVKLSNVVIWVVKN